MNCQLSTCCDVTCSDWVEFLRSLPDESVQCCVTSPPYWGLRDYGTATWEGGSLDCQHLVREDACTESSTLGGGKATTGHQREGFKQECPRCGAHRIDRQLGLERTPEEYVAKMVEGFREVRRVLRKDGTLWLNLGDSYNAHPGQRTVHDKAGYKQSTNRGSCEAASRNTPSMKAKDLVGIPWMVAFALRADGWYLRQDIIWAKGTSGERREGNVMPESVTDRCTKAHEYLFLLSKSANYFYDREAIKEPAQDWGMRDRSQWRGGTDDPKLKHHGFEDCTAENGNRRSVWRVNPTAFKEAHFATFPPKLVEPCIMAGSKQGDVVLDPFSGAGTVWLVSKKLGRHFIGAELNPSYCEMSRKRIPAIYEPAFGDELIAAEQIPMTLW